MKFVEPPRGSALWQKQHAAVRSARGQARNRLCECCWERASQWSWIHGEDPNDPNSYWALCRHCHMMYDGVWTEERKEEASERAYTQWSNGTLNREGQAERAKRDRPWEARWGTHEVC